MSTRDESDLKMTAEELRRETENRFRIMADCAPVALWMSGPDSLCTFFNQWWLTFTGRTMEEELGTGWAEGIHHEDLQRCMDTYLAAFNSRREFVMEYRLRRADGEYRWIRDHGTPRYNPDKSFAGYIGSCVDITEHKQAEREMARAHEAAVEASQLKSEFLANMSHEIRTPLNGVVGMTEILSRSRLLPKQKEQVDIIKLSADSLMAVVNDILDFSKIESGQLELDIVEFNPAEAIRETVKLFSYGVKKKKIELHAEIDSDIPASVAGDLTRFKQVLKNLIDNAIKFTDGGKVTVRVRKTSENKGNVSLRVIVQDSGVGIPESARARIFKPFSQADSSLTRRYGGTGLGLAICKRLVELMNGEIDFESRDGDGSTFWFEIALRKVSASPISRRAKPQNAATTEIKAGKRKKNPKILVVEDNPINQKVIVEMLKRIGCAPFAVGDGEAAIQIFSEKGFDLVLMDCQMSGLNGFEATGQIRKNEKNTGSHTPIIALTAHAVKGDREKCLEAGMDDYISKPIDFQVFTTTIEKWVAKTR